MALIHSTFLGEEEGGEGRRREVEQEKWRLRIREERKRTGGFQLL